MWSARWAISPSTLKMVLPEVYLGTEKQQARVEETYRTMQRYLDSGILRELPCGCILTQRTPAGQQEGAYRPCHLHGSRALFL